MTDDSKITSAVKLMSPQQLYELWERQPWSAHDIDLEQDKADWAALSGEQRDEILWVMSLFFIGEERVTTQFSGLVMAYEDEQEESYLTTQQVDEARHMQFFDRYYREVFAFEEADIKARLQRVREHVTEPFVKLFDESLVQAGQRLIADPGDRGSKVDFVTAYHMVIEGTLALTGQNFLTRYFAERLQAFPGFVEGSARSRATSTATWRTGPGICSARQAIRRWPSAFRPRSPSCCPWPRACWCRPGTRLATNMCSSASPARSRRSSLSPRCRAG